MPFLAAFEAPPRPESMKFPVFSLLAGKFGIFRDEFAADSPLQRRVHCELAPHGFGAPVIGQQLALRGGGHFPLGTGILNFRFNVSCLTRMRPPVNYHQKHGGRAGATVVVRFARYETIP